MIRLALSRVVDRVEDCILRSLPFADLATVDENRELLRPKPQEYFGIEAANVSPSSWQAAVEELNKVNHQRMPSGKLRALLRCRTKIYDLFSAERAAAATADGAQAKEAYLAADDFLSVFVFVLVRSELSQLPAVCRFMSELCDPDLLAGQHGYYLTVFESAIRCIHDADPAAEMLATAVMDAPSRQSSLSGSASLSAPSPHRLSSAGAAAEQADGEEGEEGGGEGDPRPDSPLSTGDAAELPVAMSPAPHVAGGAAGALGGGGA